MTDPGDAYDWVDDDGLSAEETERRFDALMDQGEPVKVVGSREELNEDRTRD